MEYSYELGCPSKWETLVNYSGYQERMKHPMNLVVQASGKNPVNYSEYLELSVTILVVQASGRLSSTTRDTKNSGNILRTQWSKQAGDSRQLLGVPRTNETPYELGGPRKREKSRQLLGVPRNTSIVLPFDKLDELRSF